MTNGSCWIVTESDLGQLTLNNENTKSSVENLNASQWASRVNVTRVTQESRSRGKTFDSIVTF